LRSDVHRLARKFSLLVAENKLTPLEEKKQLCENTVVYDSIPTQPFCNSQFVSWNRWAASQEGKSYIAKAKVDEDERRKREEEEQAVLKEYPFGKFASIFLFIKFDFKVDDSLTLREDQTVQLKDPHCIFGPEYTSCFVSFSYPQGQKDLMIPSQYLKQTKN
jgi:hypothetical protein